MSTDPYHAVQNEIQASLQAAAAVRASYVRIRNMRGDGDGEELSWARKELSGMLTALEADLEDLEESVKIVESTDARLFGLSDGEVKERRQYVGYVRGEIENMRAEMLTAAPPPPLVPRAQSPVGGGYGEVDHQGEWAREEQQMMMREQDRTMDSIAGALSTLAQQAGIIGREIEEHNEMLDEVESGVDGADRKLNEAMGKMRRFLRETEEKRSGWCITILIIILVILLLFIILV